MQFFTTLENLQLDIVGIVAILGEGSTSRNAQASALSWHHILPRLYPAPQALLKHHQDRKLPVEHGVVVGALSGRIRNELNFFTQLLHNDDLPDYAVQIVKVDRKVLKKNVNHDKVKQNPAFWVKKHGHLAALSVLGCCMSIALAALVIWREDGPALLATILLSATSTFVGFASWCVLDDQEENPNEDRKDNTPMGDVVIFYPRTGAFRVVRCTDKVSRLYFRVESCEHYLGDNMYRIIALFSTILLMGGLIMLGNSHAVMQTAFAVSYIILNALYWASSALDPTTHVWKHDFQIEELGFTKRMITRSADHSIIPQKSELSPAGPASLTEVESPSEYYSNRHWTQKKVIRVPTLSIIARPGEHVPVEERKPEMGFIQFTFGTRTLGSDSAQSKAAKMETNKPPKQAVTFAPDVANPAAEQQKKRSLTSALWTVIALTGRSDWARSTNIAPNNDVWDQWLSEAEQKATARWSPSQLTFVPPCFRWKEPNGKIWIQLPDWDYQTRLSTLFKEQSEITRKRFEKTPVEMAEMQKILSQFLTVMALRNFVRRWRERRERRMQEALHSQSVATLNQTRITT